MESHKERDFPNFLAEGHSVVLPLWRDARRQTPTVAPSPWDGRPGAWPVFSRVLCCLAEWHHRAAWHTRHHCACDVSRYCKTGSEKVTPPVCD